MTIGDDVKNHFGRAIRAQRAYLRLSQEQLAGRSELHRTYISDVERGVRNLSLETIDRLAKALDISVAELFAKVQNTDVGEGLVEILIVHSTNSEAEGIIRSFRNARVRNPINIVRDGLEGIDFVFASGAHSRPKNHPLPGLVIIDAATVGESSFDLLRRMKGDIRTHRIPVIVLTSPKVKVDMSDFRTLGVECFIEKPFGFEQMREALSDLNLQWGIMRPLKEKAGSSEAGGKKKR